MATQFSRRPMTYEEFESLPRYGKITELLDGEYFVVSPTFRHQELVFRLVYSFGGYLDTHPLGKVVPAPFDVVLSKSFARVIQPDVLFLTRETLGRVEKARLEGVPDLAVEVLSGDGRHDRGKKLQYYGEYGIPELWHVSQDRPEIEIYRTIAPGKLAKVLDLGPGDALGTPILPGFCLAVDDLYRDLEAE